MKTLSIRVKPNSSENVLEAQVDGGWIARVAAPPIDGAANEALLRLVALHFGVRLSQVRIKSGAASRLKRVEIDC
jgi:uncharacterized protein YggU (UPF0235/DUF167 family)